MDKGMDIFFLSFLSLCHARNLVHIYMYACHTHPSVHPSIHSPIHPSVHPCHPYITIHTTSPLLLLCCCFRPPSPPTPLLPACLPLYTLKDYHFCCCFCCILSISPLLLLLLLHFSFHVVGLFAVKIITHFFLVSCNLSSFRHYY